MSAGHSRPQRAWQRMLSGRRLDLLDPSPLDIEIGDIAHGLARVARWNGQTRGDHALSVAQHCLLVEDITSRLLQESSNSDQLFALLHDAAEYVIGDMISPFKAVMGGNYREVEDRLEAAINIWAGLKPHPPVRLKKVIKQADRQAAYIEATQLAGFEEREAARFFGLPDPDFSDIEIVPLPARDAQLAFEQRYNDLRAAH